MEIVSLLLPSLSSTESEIEAASCGSAVLCFAIAPVQVLVPPALWAPSKKADLGTWELPPARALGVGCLERLRATNEKLAMFDNVVRLIGLVGADAEMKTTKTQREYTVLSLATTAPWKNKNGDGYVWRTEWHKLVALPLGRSFQPRLIFFNSPCFSTHLPCAEARMRLAQNAPASQWCGQGWLQLKF